MSRSYGRLSTSLWRNDDYRSLSLPAQWAYQMLLGQADVTPAGTLPITLRRWSKYCPGVDVEAALTELAGHRFVVLDWDTEELLIRTFVKWDGGAENSLRRSAIISAVGAVESPLIRAAVINELDRLNVPHSLVKPDLTGASDTCSDTPPDSPSKPYRWPIEGLSDTPSIPLRGPVDRRRVVVTKGELGESTTLNHNPEPQPVREPPQPVEPERLDVDELCQHLADRIEANGAKRPPVTDRWRQACRLMLDTDHRTPDQVRAAIDWCQDDEFWRANILSMPKLREKYDQLSLQARRGQSQPRAPTTQTRVDAALSVASQLAAKGL